MNDYYWVFVAENNYGVRQVFTTVDTPIVGDIVKGVSAEAEYHDYKVIIDPYIIFVGSKEESTLRLLMCDIPECTEISRVVWRKGEEDTDE